MAKYVHGTSAEKLDDNDYGWNPRVIEGGKSTSPDETPDYSKNQDRSAPKDYSHPTAKSLSEAEKDSSKPNTLGKEKDIASAERGGNDDKGKEWAVNLDKRLEGLTNQSKNRQGKFSVRHRKGLIAGALIAIIGGGGLLAGFGLLSGPMQLVHAMNFLRDAKNFITDTQTALRYVNDMPHLQSFVNNNGGGMSEAVRRSRVGIVGNKLANSLMAPIEYDADGNIKKGGRLTRMGITFDSGRTK